MLQLAVRLQAILIQEWDSRWVVAFEPRPGCKHTTAIAEKQISFEGTLAVDFTYLVDANAGTIFNHHDLPTRDTLGIGEHIYALTCGS